MSNVDDVGAAPRREDDDAGDDALRASQKRLDKMWQKSRAVLRRHEPLRRLTDPQSEDVPCIGRSGSVVVLVKRWIA